MKPIPKYFRNNQITFHGKALSQGVAQGKAYLLKKVDIQQFRINKRAVDVVSSELARLDLSVRKSKDQISYSLNNIRHGKDDQSYLMFEAALRLLNDPAFVSPVQNTIERTSLNGESVLAEEIARFGDKAFACTDEFSAKAFLTMQDLYYRLLYNMLPADEERVSSLIKIPAGSLLVADRLAPVEVAVIPMDKVVGIIIEEGAQYSHASIMAQTLGVPVIMGLAGIGSLLDESTEVLIDGYRGYAFLNPCDATIKECQDVENRHNAASRPAVYALDDSTARSIDGFDVRLLCNASNLADMQHTRGKGITEIGLFRSEMYYLTNTVLPSDEEEIAYYKEIFSVEGIGSITFRLFDIGGDKMPIYWQMAAETDPQLGCRGIRFLLSHPDLMKRQIRNILSARQTTRVRLLLPFITTMDDLFEALEVLAQILAETKIPEHSLEVGIMIEVPSVALSLDRFLPKVDFVNLGTNDLVQYFFASNRDQIELQKYNRFTHPALLKLLKKIITTCVRHGKQLTVCGEMASDPAGCCLLAALGAKRFSVQPDATHHVRHAVSKLNVVALQNILPELFNFECADDVERKLHALGI